MTDGPSASKKLKTDDSSLPQCPYGAECYRKNPQHFKEFVHPPKSPTTSSASSTTASVTHTDPHSVSDVINFSASSQMISELPLCKYGAKCYRKNLLHFAEFSHPTNKTANDENGSDTDVYDSEEEKEKTEVKKGDILCKGLSLVKKFSQMTDDERKELIKTAFEEKLRLQQELENAKKIVAEKDKELSNLQKKLNNGLLLLEGEAEALKLETTTYFSLLPERAYKEGSASQTHFRLAESQFYRLLTGDVTPTVLKVDYVVSPKVVKKFREFQKKLKTSRGEEFSYPILGFHGTDQKNIRPICENGFKAPGEKGFKHKTDSGWYGAGVYFSEFTYYSMAYITGCSELMLCQVLPGKVFECPSLIHGATLQTGYDSHMSPCKKELVIFNTAAILPCYIIYFGDAKGAFKYGDGGELATCDQLYSDALLKPSSKVFTGMKFTLLGKMADTHGNLFKLILQHGGKKATKATFTVLVTTKEDGAVVSDAKNRYIPVVREAYIYKCILQNKKLLFKDFSL
ncbi:unnamed protein product [Lymnaea stagnalis]|uniref:BRCT domain-containing protein n=1 Tax=Lymnaea stagnalis TaxID=6523 RepID=A0AAV2H9F7_LYMST